MVKKYFDDLSQTDRESDSFRYPFHIVWELDEWEGKFTIKPIFNDQTHIDLVKFANKFEAAYEIIEKWYLKETANYLKWYMKKEIEQFRVQRTSFPPDVLSIQKLC